MYHYPVFLVGETTTFFYKALAYTVACNDNRTINNVIYTGNIQNNL